MKVMNNQSWLHEKTGFFMVLFSLPKSFHFFPVDNTNGHHFFGEGGNNYRSIPYNRCTISIQMSIIALIVFFMFTISLLEYENIFWFLN